MTPQPLHRLVVDSPVGSLTLVASGVGLRAVLWSGDDESRVPDAAHVVDDPHPPAPVTALLERAARQLREYFDGTRTAFDVPLDPIGSDFQRAAWRTLQEIPHGETVSYGEQAERMGDRNKARAVGAANGRNPIPIIVPCHRVVGSTGSLTGFAGGVETKRWLLDHERRVAGRTLL